MRKKRQLGIQKSHLFPWCLKINQLGGKQTLCSHFKQVPKHLLPPACTPQVKELCTHNQTSADGHLHLGRTAAEAQHASGPQSSPRSFQGASFVMHLAHRPQQAVSHHLCANVCRYTGWEVSSKSCYEPTAFNTNLQCWTFSYKIRGKKEQGERQNKDLHV